MKKIFAMFLAGAFFTGCATAGGWFNDTNTNARIITKGIASEYLAHNKLSIEPVLQASTDALTYVQSGNVTLDMLESGIMTAIAPSVAKLTPDGQAAAVVFVSEISAELKRELAANNITEPDKVVLEVVTFIQWVHESSVSAKILAGS